MRTIRSGKIFWSLNDVWRAWIEKGKLCLSSVWDLTAEEWSSLCAWVEEKRKEGRLWKEGK